MENNPDTFYKLLLDELYDKINKNIIITENNKLKITKPNVFYDKTKKTMWINFKKNCYEINRPIDSLKKFIEDEYSVKTSINSKDEIIINGRYSHLIETTFKKYIKNFVICHICKSINTKILHDKNLRLDYLLCNNCNSQKFIS